MSEITTTKNELHVVSNNDTMNVFCTKNKNDCEHETARMLLFEGSIREWCHECGVTVEFTKPQP